MALSLLVTVNSNVSHSTGTQLFKKVDNTIHKAPVVQKLDSAIHRIDRYPVDKYLGNQLRYTLDRDLSIGYRYSPFEQLGPDKTLPNG